MRRVTTGPTRKHRHRHPDGLKPGEQVIVDGMQKVRPGQVVHATGARRRGAEVHDLRVFVDRPRLAFVIAIVITLAGIIAIPTSRWRNFPTSCRRRSR